MFWSTLEVSWANTLRVLEVRILGIFNYLKIMPFELFYSIKYFPTQFVVGFLSGIPLAFYKGYVLRKLNLEVAGP